MWETDSLISHSHNNPHVVGMLQPTQLYKFIKVIIQDCLYCSSKNPLFISNEKKVLFSFKTKRAAIGCQNRRFNNRLHCIDIVSIYESPISKIELLKFENTNKTGKKVREKKEVSDNIRGNCSGE